MKLTFESTPCHRCGGTGHFAHFGVCFLCGGAKVKLTRAGRKASAKWTEWRTANLSVAPETAVGQRVLIPQQFAGPYNGGTFIRFRRPLEVLRAELVPVIGGGHVQPDGSLVPFAPQWHITLKLARNPQSPWLQYDAEKGELTITLCGADALYRLATRDELLAVVPTLGKGATLVDDAAVAA